MNQKEREKKSEAKTTKEDFKKEEANKSKKKFKSNTLFGL
jgi:hypothetical protein